MTKSPIILGAVLCLSTSFFIASNSLASDEYDEDTYGPENPIVWSTPVSSSFDHKFHTMEVELECDSCHDDLFEMESGAATANGDFTMAAFKEGKYCGACHDGYDAFDSSSQCEACHYPPTEKIVFDKPVKASFDHQFHTMEVELACDSCHDDLFKMESGAATANGDFTMAAFKEGKYCGACHDGYDAFDSSSQCEACHYPPTEKIVFDKPVKAVIFSHDIHVDRGGLSCELCHKEVFAMEKGHVANSKLASSDDPAVKRQYLESLHSKFCGTCHDSNQAFGYLTRCTVCHIGVKGYEKMYGGEEKNDAHGKSGH